jgi:hypothetical protein
MTREETPEEETLKEGREFKDQNNSQALQVDCEPCLPL